jgi:hypothetical protein
MTRRLSLFLLVTACLAALFAGAQLGSAKPPPRPPKGFFGIGPQTGLTDEDASYMQAGGIESVRWPVIWASIQPTAKSAYDWNGLDSVVSVAARHNLRVLPFLVSTPRWISRKPTTLPIDSAKARSAWRRFLRAAVERYGPGGEFWAEHGPGVRTQIPGTVEYEPAIPRPMPIRSWQIWNEANFFYFAYPTSPQRYAELVKISSPAINGVDPGAKVILTGLFGEPTAGGPRGMPSVRFLERLYRTPGIERRFDGIALHPYAVDAETLEELVEAIHDVTVENRDRVPLYITEMGWGSENNFEEVAFEQGPRGQTKQLKASYRYLLENQRRLNLKEVYWYSWKDIVSTTCNFCDSVGLFHGGPGFQAKPAWYAFVGITRGRAQP